jgi:hypothetical protein
MSERYPDSDAHEAERSEGEASHELGAHIIKESLQGREVYPEVGYSMGNGVALTAESIEGARVYAEDVLAEVCNRGITTSNIHVEERIECKEIHELSFGTPDCWAYDVISNRVIIWDYKFGFIPIEAILNWQGINYWSGISDKLKIDGVSDQHITVEFRIIQPRAYHRHGSIRKWATTASDLRQYINTLSNSARLALEDYPKCTSGKQCRYCSGRHVCEAGLSAGVELYEGASASLPLDITPHAMGLQLKIVKRAIQQLKGLETGYTEAIGSLIKSGTTVPFWNNAPSVGREEWSSPKSEVLLMADLMGVDVKKTELITPKQARTAGLPASVVKRFSKHKSSYKLEPVNDNETKEIFK